MLGVFKFSFCSHFYFKLLLIPCLTCSIDCVIKFLACVLAESLLLTSLSSGSYLEPIAESFFHGH
jgi:hypothetical protein